MPKQNVVFENIKRIENNKTQRSNEQHQENIYVFAKIKKQYIYILKRRIYVHTESCYMCLLRYRHRVMVLMHDDTAWFCAQYHKKRVKTKNCIGKQHHTLNETNEKKNETYKEQATAIHTSAKHENSFMSVIAHWIHDDDDEK